MIVYTGGTFDLLHAGHIEFLERLAILSAGGHRGYFPGEGAVVVSLNTDEFVKEYKGKPPINPYNERKKCLEACKYVSRVVENTGGADSRPAIEAVKPDVVAIGSDWHGDRYLTQMQFSWEWLHARGIGLLYIPRITPVSTSGIKERIFGGDSGTGTSAGRG